MNIALNCCKLAGPPYIDFNIFGDAESESAIIFHVRPIWGLKLGPKRGVKFKVFDKVFNRNNLYIDFNIFGDAESESAIIFHVRLTWGLKLGSKRGVKFKVFDKVFD